MVDTGELLVLTVTREEQEARTGDRWYAGGRAASAFAVHWGRGAVESLASSGAAEAGRGARRC